MLMTDVASFELNINQLLIPTTKTKKERMKVHCLKENVLLLHILTSVLLSPVCLLIDLFCLLSQLNIYNIEFSLLMSGKTQEHNHKNTRL